MESSIEPILQGRRNAPLPTPRPREAAMTMMAPMAQEVVVATDCGGVECSTTTANNSDTMTEEEEEEGNPWARAREASHGVILQAALADLESKAAKQEQAFLIAQEKLQVQQEMNSKLVEETTNLQALLARQSSETQRLRTELESTKFTVESVEESSKQGQERLDRLQAEGDALRDEIRYVSIFLM
jgi:hypothetical protein